MVAASAMLLMYDVVGKVNRAEAGNLEAAIKKLATKKQVLPTCPRYSNQHSFFNRSTDLLLLSWTW
jgi:hypothetical protein